MVAGMYTCVRPTLPPKVWDSGEKFHPAAKELAAIREANMTKRPVGSSTPTRVKVELEEVDMEEKLFDKKMLSSAAFLKFEEARATVKSTGTRKFSPYLWQAGGYHVKVIPLGTSSALPSKYRNGWSGPCFPLRDKSDGYEFW